MPQGALAAFALLLDVLLPTGAAERKQPAAAPGVTTRQPTGKWIVDFADSQCFLSREYGTAAKPLTLLFEPSIMGDRLRLVVLQGGRANDLGEGKAKVLFEPGGELIERDYSSFGYQGKPIIRHGMTLEREHFAPLEHTAVLAIRADRRLNERFAVPRLITALKLLDACRADLLKQWGMPPEVQAKFRTPAKPHKGSLARIFSPNDYPAGAVSRGEQGKVVVRIHIDASGDVTACDAIVSSGNQLLDSTTCRIILERARFEPARDVDGKPMTSFEVTDVSWTTP